MVSEEIGSVSRGNGLSSRNLIVRWFQDQNDPVLCPLGGKQAVTHGSKTGQSEDRGGTCHATKDVGMTVKQDCGKIVMS